MIEGKQYGFPADVWSFGCLAYELMVGRPPFLEPGEAGSNFAVALVDKRIINFNNDLKFPPMMSDAARDLINKCLRKDPGERWTVKQLLKHPFIKLQAAPKKVRRVQSEQDALRRIAPPKSALPVPDLKPLNSVPPPMMQMSPLLTAYQSPKTPAPNSTANFSPGASKRVTLSKDTAWREELDRKFGKKARPQEDSHFTFGPTTRSTNKDEDL